MSSCMPNADLHEKVDLKGTADDKMLVQVVEYSCIPAGVFFFAFHS